MGSGGHRSRLKPGALRRAGIAAFWLAAVLGLLLSPVQICPFALFFHTPCPGCGLTRGVLAMVHGDFQRAASFHPLSFVLAPVILGAIAIEVTSYVKTGALRSTPAVPRGWAEIGAAALIAALLGVWIARFLGWLGGPVAV